MLPKEKDALRIGLKVLIEAAPDDAEARRVPTTWYADALASGFSQEKSEFA